MLNAFLWGLFATSSLIIGGIIAMLVTPGKKFLGIIMAFGAGTLFSAVAYELVFEAVKMAPGSGFPLLGFVTGALVFFLSDKLLEGSGSRVDDHTAQKTSLLIPMVLAIILDGVPESLVIGLGIKEAGSVSIAMLVAVFISNLPESIAGTTSMKASKWKWRKVMTLWFGIALICAVSTAVGFTVLGDASVEWMAVINAFAGGAILMMLSNTMIPEAYEHGGKLAGVFTVFGFAVSIAIIVLEHAAH